MVSRKGNTEKSWLKKWTPLVVMGLAILIIVIDTTLLNVSLGTIIRELKTNIQSLQWVITAYSLTLASLTITGGRFGDLFGRKKMFVLGAVIFAVGSFIASISHSVGMLLIGESIIEGVGAALMMPATTSLLVSTYKGRDRSLALGVWGGMAAAGSAIGPILGGWLTSHFSWRWGFRINVAVAAVLVLGSVIISEARDLEEKPVIDWLGVGLSSIGLLAGVFGIIESSKYGWWIAKEVFSVSGHQFTFGSLSIVPVSLYLSLCLLTSFVVWEGKVAKRGWTPLVNMRLFKNKQFTTGALTSAILSMGQIGLIFALPVFLQGVRGYDALHTGYAMLPMSLALLVMAPLGGFMGGKIRPKRIVQAGLILNALGLLYLRQVMSVDAGRLQLVLPLLVYGAGVGLGMSQLSNLTLSAVSVQEAGEVSGVNNTLRQIGSSLGSAIVGTVLIVTLGNSLRSGVQQSQQVPPAIREEVAIEVSQQASAVEFGSPIKSAQPISEEAKTDIRRIANESTVHANKNALLFTAGFALLALLISTQLPKSRNVERNESLAAGH